MTGVGRLCENPLVGRVFPKSGGHAGINYLLGICFANSKTLLARKGARGLWIYGYPGVLLKKGGGRVSEEVLKVLVVDDERPIAEILKYNLEKEGFGVLVAYDGEEALRLAFQERPDIILLDIMLPSLDGFSVCKQIRQEMDVPIIMLTARETEIDKIMGLEIGADDYVTKPFSIRELMARVKATLRRVQMQKKTPELLTCGDLTLDLGKMELKKGENRIELTYREFNLMAFLIKNAGYVFSREKLLEEVWDYEFIGDLRTVDVTIRRLREKVEADPGNPYYLCTKRGVGYYLRRP